MAAITTAGYLRKSEADWIAGIVAECRATVDPDFDESPDSAGGQIVSITGSKFAELDEVLEAVYAALSPNASGVNLDRLAALTNSFRLLNESDAAFRIRRIQELPAQGATTEPAIRAALSKVEGMLAVRVISNRTMTTIDGRPPKSVESIVLGDATVADIAAAIWSKLPAGIEPYGTSTTTLTDEEGNSQTIGYSVATPADWWVRISADVDEAGYPGVTAMKERIRDFSSGVTPLELTDGTYIPAGVDLGATLWRSRFSAAASTIAGVRGVTRVEFSEDGTTWEDIDKPLPPRGYLGRVESGEIVRGFDVDHVLVVTT